MYDIPYHNVDLKHYSFLVTGGAGFIGSNLVEYLLKYNAGKVRILDNLSNGYFKNIEPFLSDSRVEYIEGDITDEQVCQRCCEGINIVFHQAALGSVPRSIQNPIASNAANVTGFLNMLVAAKDKKVERFIYASSSSVYGDDNTLPKVENRIGQPLSPYAVTKRVNELYAQVFGNTYDMKTIGLRYFNVFGPKQNPKNPYAAVIPLFIDAILNNRPAKIFGDGNQSRDFTFVENAVQANIKAAFTTNEKAFNQVYNIAFGSTISVNELFEAISALAGSKIRPVYSEPRKGDIKDSLADISKAKELLGYNPLFNVHQGLKILFDWYQRNISFIEK
ncbi:MAG: SDR family oxidoreductase [Cytophagaceae bacterium]|nr:SDR family oxidoreductase [Cytophagaceae bacterium]MDW8455693.1 SDR family oxidoreductase [Cytophagaceae bacterium]